MPSLLTRPRVHVLFAALVLLLVACADSPGQSTDFTTSCEGAYEDANGYCRLTNGRFANASC